MTIYKKLKPFISLVCALLIIFSTVSILVYAGDAKSITASTDASVKQGNIAYCYVNIDSSEGLAALDVTVHFDPAKVKILNVYNSINCTIYDSVTNTDNIQFSYIFDGKGTASETRLFYFKYQVLSDADVGNSYFDITIGEAYDNSLNDISVSGSRCNFYITEAVTNKTCSVSSTSSVSTSIEQEFTLNYRFNTYQMASGTAVISYDSELFEVVNVQNGAFLTNKIVDVNSELNGEIYISFLGTEYYPNTNFVSVTFRTIKNVTEASKIVFKAQELIDKELNSISCNGYTTNVNVAFDDTYTGDAPAMKLDGAFSYENMQISLTVSLEANSHLGAGDFVIAFDPELISYNSCSKEFSPTFFNINDKNVENGELKFHIISLSDITTEETVLTVVFDVKYPYSCKSTDFTITGKSLTDSLTESILLNFIDDSVLLEYKITFSNEDGTILKSDMYNYGDVVIPPEPPVKEKDDYYIYTFKGWDKEVVNCCADAEYKAIFTAEHYHTYEDVVIAPTCTTQGYTTHICACGDSNIDNYFDATGHNYVDGICSACGNESVVFVETDMHIEYLTYGENTVSNIKDNLKHKDTYVKIYDINGTLLEDTDLVGTGSTVYIYDSATNELLNTYTVVLYGDVNGDGLINYIDKDTITSVATCTGIIDNKWFLMAADTNHDGAVDGFDVIETELQALDMHAIEQKNDSAYLPKDEEDESKPTINENDPDGDGWWG